MEKKRTFFLFVILLFFLSISVSAASITDDLHLNIQTTSSGAVTTGTFNFAFNISNNSNCATKNIVYSNSTSLTTDSRGVISHYLPNVSLNYDQQYWLCYYRDGVLIDTLKIARTPYTFRAKNITLSGVKVDSDFDLGNYNFTTKGGWTSGGVSILGGNLYAQKGYFYNITSLNVSKQNLTIVNDFIVYGDTELKKDLTVNTNTLFVDSNLGRVGIGTLTPSQAFEVNGYILSDNFNTTGNNVYAGINAGGSNTVDYVTVVGRNAGQSNAGRGLSAIGYQAGYGNTGIYSSAVGYQAGLNNKGDYVISFGNYVGVNNIGDYVVAFGSNAANNNHGDYVTGIGYDAALDQTGNYSTGIGYQALTGNAADNVIAIGYQAGLVNSRANQFIIRQANVNSIPLIQGDFNSGNIGIGTATPNNKLEVIGNVTISKNFSVDSGTLFVNSNTNKVGIGTSTPLSELQVAGDITQASGQSIIRQIVHKGKKENFVGNTGMGQSTDVFNSYNTSITQDEFPNPYGNAAFSGGVFDGESVWLSPSYSRFVVKINPATGKMTNYTHGNGDYAFYGACYDGEAVWFAPFSSPNFMKIYNNGTMVNYTNNYGTAAFSGCVFTGEELVFIPEEADKIVAINPYTNVIRNVTNIDISSAYGSIAFNGGIWDGRLVWMVPYFSPYITSVNMTSGKLVNYTHGSGSNVYVGGCFDGEKIWLAPGHSTTIDNIDPATGEITKYSYDRELNPPGQTAFIGCTFDGTSVWFTPLASNHTIKLNPKTGEIVKYYNNDQDVGYRGAIFDGHNIWLTPHGFTPIVRIHPPEFGQDSLFTSGNLNVGGDIYIGSSDHYLSSPPTGNYGTIQVDGTGITWAGYSIEGRDVFMSNGGNNVGIYNDVDNQWVLYATHAGATDLRYAGSAKIATTNTGVSVTGDVDVSDDIYLDSGNVVYFDQDDGSNTYIQHDNANNWLQFNVDGNEGMRLRSDGQIFADLGGGSGYVGIFDIAETLETKNSRENDFCDSNVSCLAKSTDDDLNYGDVVCIDTSDKRIIKKCDEANSKLVVGAISNTTVISMGAISKNGYPVAVAGLV
ncbi:MAG: hypothetical protein ACFFG0_13910, partial [Candidatus Thorarchaeota archaeon]